MAFTHAQGLHMDGNGTGYYRRCSIRCWYIGGNVDDALQRNGTTTDLHLCRIGHCFLPFCTHSETLVGNCHNVVHYLFSFERTYFGLDFCSLHCCFHCQNLLHYGRNIRCNGCCGHHYKERFNQDGEHFVYGTHWFKHCRLGKHILPQFYV